MRHFLINFIVTIRFWRWIQFQKVDQMKIGIWFKSKFYSKPILLHKLWDHWVARATVPLVIRELLVSSRTPWKPKTMLKDVINQHYIKNINIIPFCIIIRLFLEFMKRNKMNLQPVSKNWTSNFWAYLNTGCLGVQVLDNSHST